MMVLLTPLLMLGVLVLVIAPISLYYAWAASILWGWFVVPVFGLPALSVLQVWGICLTMGMLRPRFDPKKTDKDGVLDALGALVAGPLLALGIGYAIKFWWM